MSDTERDGRKNRARLELYYDVLSYVNDTEPLGTSRHQLQNAIGIAHYNLVKTVEELRELSLIQGEGHNQKRIRITEQGQTILSKLSQLFTMISYEATRYDRYWGKNKKV